MTIDDSGNETDKELTPTINQYNDDALNQKVAIGDALSLMNYETTEAKCPVNRCTLKN